MTLITGFGADKTMTAVISGEADIGFMGAEASIYATRKFPARWVSCAKFTTGSVAPS